MAPIAMDLGMSHQTVTNAGLKELRNFKHLRDLTLWNANNVTDAGMKELKDLTTLQNLNLWNLRITDAGLKELKDLKALRSLSLVNTQVTDAWVTASEKEDVDRSRRYSGQQENEGQAKALLALRRWSTAR